MWDGKDKPYEKILNDIRMELRKEDESFVFSIPISSRELLKQ